jgi:hypothetical protein
LGQSSRADIEGDRVSLMVDKSVHKFSIIHHYLSPNVAVTHEGHIVKREDKIFLVDPDGFARFVACPPMDNHFIYKDPEYEKGTIGRCATMCTCGAMAVIVGYNVYKHDASPSSVGSTPGEMLVCLNHATFGRHSDGST